jgi:hypothetical protein
LQFSISTSFHILKGLMMNPQIKNGLLAGAVGAVINFCVSLVLGFCGPLVGLAAGGVAGFLTARGGGFATKGDAAKAGAISGAVAGAVVLVAQVGAGIANLIYIQVSGTQLPFGSVPGAGSSGSEMAIFYGTGLLTGVCIGIVDIVVGALAGAGAGALAGGNAPAAPSEPSM